MQQQSFWECLKAQCVQLKGISTQQIDNSFDHCTHRALWIYVPLTLSQNKSHALDQLAICRVFCHKEEDKADVYILDPDKRGHVPRPFCSLKNTPLKLKDFMDYLKQMAFFYAWESAWRMVRNDQVVYAHPNEIEEAFFAPVATWSHLSSTTTETRIASFKSNTLPNDSRMIHLHLPHIFPNRIFPLQISDYEGSGLMMRVALPIGRRAATYFPMSLKIKQDKNKVWCGYVDYICGDGHAMLIHDGTSSSPQQRNVNPKGQITIASRGVGSLMISLADELCKMLGIGYCEVFDGAELKVRAPVVDSTVSASSQVRPIVYETVAIKLRLWKAIKSGCSWYNQFGFWQEDMRPLQALTNYLQDSAIYSAYHNKIVALRMMQEIVPKFITKHLRNSPNLRTWDYVLPFLHKKLSPQNYAILTSSIFDLSIGITIFDCAEHAWLMLQKQVMPVSNQLLLYEEENGKHVKTFRGFLIFLFRHNVSFYHSFTLKTPFCAELGGLMHQFDWQRDLIKHYNKGLLRTDRKKRQLINIGSVPEENSCNSRQRTENQSSDSDSSSSSNDSSS
jgi:hypothetical protein